MTTRAKHIALTRTGLDRLAAALPKVIDVQQRMFGEEAGPDGELLAAVLKLDRISAASV